VKPSGKNHDFTAAAQSIGTEESLDELLTRPRLELVQFMKNVQTPLVILGAGGKMGPTLAVLAHRAAEQGLSESGIVIAPELRVYQASNLFAFYCGG